MKKVMSRSMRLAFTIILVVTSFVPMQASSASRGTEVEVSQSEPIREPISVVQAAPEQSTSPDNHKRAAYQVTENTDPYLMSLALGTDEPESKYGPKRNLFEEGIPEHAYSPFDAVEKRETCPQGGCDYVEGRVLIKLDAEQVFSQAGTNQVELQDQELTAALEALEISNLRPVFPNAKRPAAGEMVEAIEGGLVEKPDLTRWLQGETQSAKGMSEVIRQLQKTVGIAVAEPDYIRRPVGEKSETVSTSPVALPGPGTDPLFAQQWYLEAANVPEAWAYLESQGLPAGGSRDVIVAVIDTGVDYTHPDLAANMWINQAEFYGSAGSDDDGNGYVDDIYGADTVYPDGDPLDDHGHGTHVAGIIAAQAGNGIGGVGVAYNTRIMAIKAAQYSGVLASSDIAEGLYYAVTKGADVINMSFGSYARSTIEEDALTIAFGHAVLVAAAGNDSMPSLPCMPTLGNFFPAAYNWILGVMSRRQYPNDVGNYLSRFSNYDCVPYDVQEYELMAPGESIWSTLPGEQYAAWSGTSMAAPVVSGIAALARTKWSDTNVYSSRFIMGQISATGEMLGQYRNSDALNALSITPQPKLNYLQHWVFDTQSLDPSNDEDGIVDSGELIDLGIMIRNHSGQSTSVTVKLEPIAESAVLPDPYVTMITDTVVYEPIGSFNWQDNGLIYEGEELVGVEFPFRFTTAPDTPNDHVIPFRLTMTTNNGLDPEDETSYVFEERFYLMVQRGVELPFIIDSDMTLTKEHYWILSRPMLIAEGATLTVTEGTQIQFYSGFYRDRSWDFVNPYIQTEGTFNIIGSAEEPVEIFPALDWKTFEIEIQNASEGYTSISYAKISNPHLGPLGSFIDPQPTLFKPINHIDHAYFWEEYFGLTELGVNAQEIDTTIFKDLGVPGFKQEFILQNYSDSSSRIDSSLFDNTIVELINPVTNSVFVNNYRSGLSSPGASFSSSGFLMHEPSFLRTAFPTVNNGNTYVFVGSGDWLDPKKEFLFSTNFANAVGGFPVTVDGEEESIFLNTLRKQSSAEAFDSLYSDMDCGEYSCWNLFAGHMTIGLNSLNDQCEYRWISGDPLSYENWFSGEPSGDPCLSPFVINPSYGWISTATPGPIMLELTGVVSDEQLAQARQVILENGLLKDFYNNAILNHWWDTDSTHWFNFTMDKNREYIRFIDENYWGEASTDQIEESIVDFHDDFNLGLYRYEPILTEAPVTAYPFVVDVVLSTDTQPDTVVVGAEEVTFSVKFNRDMDQDIQPIVSFGPAEPFTDFIIDGSWTGPRTWVGSFVVTPVTGNGYQFIRVSNAVAADDPWLVTGRDAGRFRFSVIVSGSAAMNLQATGGNSFIDLMWTQTDFDLLAGFNLYRSEEIDGTYSKINNFIIPPQTRNIRDLDVTPGIPYFYKFTVVKTDMGESEFSNVASATPIDTVPPVLIHSPVTSAVSGQPLTITASATDNVQVLGTRLFSRHVGETTYLPQEMVNVADNVYNANLAGSYMSSPGIEYYIETTDGVSITSSGRPGNPHFISISDTPVLTSVTPNKGPVAGGTTVTITGSNFQAGSEVTFGGAPATNVILNSSNQITCSTPPHFPSAVDVRVTNATGGFGVLLNGFTYEAQIAQISLPITGGGQGNFVSVPVNAANFQGLLAVGMTIVYDPEILLAQSATTGSLTSGFSFASNLNTPGLVDLSMSSGSMVSGSGTLAVIEFEVIGEPGSISPLTISSHLFNDGAIQADIEDGSFSVDDVYNVAGSVDYFSNSLPVQGVRLSLQGDLAHTALSGIDGNFIVQGAPAGSYVLSASKEDQVNGISAYDASLALQHDVDLIQLTDAQQIAADVNGSGVVNSMDASYILQHSAGMITSPFPGVGVTWKFIPEERVITDLAASLTGQDFTAVLVGDPTGNWTADSETQSHEQKTEAADAIISMPEVSVIVSGSVEMPVGIQINQGKVFGIDLEFTYDPDQVQIEDITLGSDLTDWVLVTNLATPGIVRVAMAGTTPITGTDELFKVELLAVGQPNTTSIIPFTAVSLNEGEVSASFMNGLVHIKNSGIYLPWIAR